MPVAVALLFGQGWVTMNLRGKDLLVKASTVTSEDSLCRGITDLPSQGNK
jgi:hypothetical protein